MQKTKDVDYNLMEQRNMRASTEETKRYLIQEEDRRSKREENQQFRRLIGEKESCNLFTQLRRNLGREQEKGREKLAIS